MIVDRATVPGFLEAEATFSDDRRLRFTCLRRRKPGRLLPVVMLNPSTADAVELDPTLRRVDGFAAREGFAGFVVMNLWALRATDPAALWASVSTFHHSEELRQNLEVMRGAVQPGPVLVGWGAFSKCPAALGSYAAVRAMVVAEHLRRLGGQLTCLGVTGDGWPRHPLYVSGIAPMVPWTEPERWRKGYTAEIAVELGGAPAEVAP